MDATTIKIHEDTKAQLDQFREYRNESYDEVIKKVVFIARTAEKEPELSKEAIEAIKRAKSGINVWLRLMKLSFKVESDGKRSERSQIKKAVRRTLIQIMTPPMRGVFNSSSALFIL